MHWQLINKRKEKMSCKGSNYIRKGEDVFLVFVKAEITFN